MSKVDRQKVYQKYDGRCAYCGREIIYKDMQVDHIIPKSKYSERHQCLIVKGRLFTEYGLNDFQNLNPACRRCNHYKRSNSLSEFRMLMSTIHKRIASQYISKVALDYGIIMFKPFHGRFYFELHPDATIRALNAETGEEL